MSEAKNDPLFFFLSELLESEVTEKNLSSVAKKYKNNTLQLWEGFTRNKGLIASYLQEKDFLIAYLLGFHSANKERMEVLLNRLEDRTGLLKTIEKVSVWDFGCGLGAMSLAFLESLTKHHKKAQNLNFFDTSPLALSLVEKYFKNKSQEKPQIIIGSFLEHLPEISKLSKDHVHVFLFGYVLNELESHQLKIVSSWLNKLKNGPPSLVLVVDSGDENLCPVFMNLRDYLVKEGLHSIYPCPHDKPCPLPKKDDRCYSESLWERSKIQILIDEILRHPRRVMASSSYAFVNEPLFQKRNSSLPRVEKVLVGLPKDSQNPRKAIPLYCNKRGQFDKRGLVSIDSFNLLRGEISQVKKSSKS